MESFNGRPRDELLNIEEFGSLTEAKTIIEDWRIEYNTYRPHSSLGGLNPTEYAHTNNPDHAWTPGHLLGPRQCQRRQIASRKSCSQKLRRISASRLHASLPLYVSFARSPRVCITISLGALVNPSSRWRRRFRSRAADSGRTSATVM